MLNLVLALLAGVVTVAAPCTLPMLPILLGASVGQTGKLRPAMIALGFVHLVFRGRFVAERDHPIFSTSIPMPCARGAAILLLGFGLLMVWPAPFEWLSIRLNGLTAGAAGDAASRQGNIGGFVLGTTLGLVWTPCAGPGARLDPHRGRDVQRHRLGERAAWWSTRSVRRSRCWRLPMAARPSPPASAASRGFRRGCSRDSASS